MKTVRGCKKYLQIIWAENVLENKDAYQRNLASKVVYVMSLHDKGLETIFFFTHPILFLGSWYIPRYAAEPLN